MAFEQWSDKPAELDTVQSAFVQRLRARAEQWPPDASASTMLGVPGDEIYGPLLDEQTSTGRLVVVLEVVGDGAILLTCGAFLDGDRLQADTLHHQLFTLPAEPTSMALSVTGTPEQLADRAADWFEPWLTVPLVRQEWDGPDGSLVQTWGRGDTGERLVLRGRFRKGLGAPDRTVLISGDASRLAPDIQG